MSAEATVSVRIRREDHAALKEMARRVGGNLVGQVRVMVEERQRREWRLCGGPGGPEDVGRISASAPEDFGPDGVGAAEERVRISWMKT